MKKLNPFIYIIVFIIVLLISACGASEAAIQQAIAETEAARPTPTIVPNPTPIPFSALDLELILINYGDLPPGYEAAQISIADEYLLYSDYYIKQGFSYKGNWGGAVRVYIYEDTNSTQDAYEHWLRVLPVNNLEVDVGEDGRAGTNSGAYTLTALAFIRCHSVVYVQFMETQSLEHVVSYGVRLDERITPFVCP